MLRKSTQFIDSGFRPTVRHNASAKAVEVATAIARTVHELSITFDDIEKVLVSILKDENGEVRSAFTNAHRVECVLTSDQEHMSHLIVRVRWFLKGGKKKRPLLSRNYLVNFYKATVALSESA